MNDSMESRVAALEYRLRTAMLDSDVRALDELLAPDLVFTNHLGHLISKEDDLAAHRSGVLKIDALECSEQQIRYIGDIAIVSVRMQVCGRYAGNPANGDLRFTRVWALSSEPAAVVAAHACIIATSNG